MNSANETASSPGQAQPITISCSRADGQLVCDKSFQEIDKLVSEGRIVLLRGVFSPSMMQEYRDGLMRWAKETETFPHGQSPSAFPDINYHRIDDGSIPGVCPHIFHQFGFNTIENLPAYISDLSLQIADTMRFVQNKVAGTDFPLSLTGLRLKVIHYPAGGGFLAKHTHPLEPQRIGLIASLSMLGRDVTAGAACFETPFGRVDTTKYHDIGDIVIFRYDLPHEVTGSDPDKVLNWESPAGKWSVVLELRETHGKSHGQTPKAA
jgi:hypothetical protein